MRSRPSQAAVSARLRHAINNGFNDEQRELLEALVHALEPGQQEQEEEQAEMELETALERLSLSQKAYMAPAASVKRSDALQRLERWLRDGGVKGELWSLSNDDAKNDVEMALDGGLFARATIEPNMELMRLPHRLVLKAVERRVLPDDALCKSVPSLALILALLEQLRLGARSPFAAYLEALPANDVGGALDAAAWRWRLPQQRAALAGTIGGLRRMASTVRRASVQHYVYVVTHPRLPRLLHALSWYEFAYASAVVMSRQNRLSDGGLALIPGWDMANHAVDGAGTIDTGDEIIAESGPSQHVAANEPITIKYGERPSAQLLVYQGFIVEDDAPDYIELQLRVDDIERGDPALAKMRRLLVQQRVAADHRFRFRLHRSPPTTTTTAAAVAWPEDLLVFARLCVMDRVDAGVALRNPTLLGPLSTANERRALDALHDWFVAVLHRSDAERHAVQQGPEASELLSDTQRRLGETLYRRHRAMLQDAVQRCVALAADDEDHDALPKTTGDDVASVH